MFIGALFGELQGDIEHGLSGRLVRLEGRPGRRHQGRDPGVIRLVEEPVLGCQLDIGRPGDRLAAAALVIQRGQQGELQILAAP
jgi:hypothetical protein